MTDRRNRRTRNQSRFSRRTALIVGGVALAVVLVGAGIAGVVAANRPAASSHALAPAAKPAAGGTGGASASAATSVPAITPPATSSPVAAGVGPIGGAIGAGKSPSKKATPPSQAVLSSLKPGQWRLYGSRVVSAGRELHSGSSTDVQGIVIECEALGKSGSGYAYATMQIACTASGPASGKSGPWRLFGTWVLTPGDRAKAGQRSGQGIEGAVGGKSTLRPPSSSSKLVAGFSPIGAYRSKSAGVIRNGTFTGNAVFEGVLNLPSVPVPPPTQ